MKKKKRQLTKKQKQTILKSLEKNIDALPVGLSQTVTPAPQITAKPEPKPVFLPTPQSTKINYEVTTVKELKKIGVVLAIILVLFGAVLFADSRTTYISQAGKFITQKLGI